MWRKILCMVELTGNQVKLDAFIHLLGQYRILELARTGITGLGRGMNLEETEGPSII